MGITEDGVVVVMVKGRVRGGWLDQGLAEDGVVVVVIRVRG